MFCILPVAHFPFVLPVLLTTSNPQTNINHIKAFHTLTLFFNPSPEHKSSWQDGRRRQANVHYSHAQVHGQPVAATAANGKICRHGECNGEIDFFGKVVDVLHPGRANVSKSELRDMLAKMYKVRCRQIC